MNEPQEIEVKFYVRDLAKIEERARELNAILIQARIHETNLRYDTPQGELRAKGQVLRLRQDDQARMTYKGTSKKQSGVMSRTEIEFVVEDFERAKQLVEALGYQTIVFYEKYRTTYTLNHTHIMLDELPYGNFIEIEGEDIPSIRNMTEKLGLRWEAAIESSYHVLFERVARPRKLDTSKLTFDAFKSGKPDFVELAVEEADVFGGY